MRRKWVMHTKHSAPNEQLLIIIIIIIISPVVFILDPSPPNTIKDLPACCYLLYIKKAKQKPESLRHWPKVTQGANARGIQSDRASSGRWEHCSLLIRLTHAAHDHEANHYELENTAKRGAMQKEARLLEPSCLSPTVTPSGGFQKDNQPSGKHWNPSKKWERN